MPRAASRNWRSKPLTSAEQGRRERRYAAFGRRRTVDGTLRVAGAITPYGSCRSGASPMQSYFRLYTYPCADAPGGEADLPASFGPAASRVAFRTRSVGRAGHDAEEKPSAAARFRAGQWRNRCGGRGTSGHPGRCPELPDLARLDVTDNAPGRGSAKKDSAREARSGSFRRPGHREADQLESI